MSIITHISNDYEWDNSVINPLKKTMHVLGLSKDLCNLQKFRKCIIWPTTCRKKVDEN